MLAGVGFEQLGQDAEQRGVVSLAAQASSEPAGTSQVVAFEVPQPLGRFEQRSTVAHRPCVWHVSYPDPGIHIPLDIVIAYDLV